MVFLYGYDIPIVEVIVSLSLLSLITLVLLLVSLRRSKETNKKLDLLMKEEKEFKNELDITRQEEDQQLGLIRGIVKELHTLNDISREEHEGMSAVQRLAKKASKHFKGKSIVTMTPEIKAVLDELAHHVDKLDHVSARENRQLDTINRIVGRMRR